MRANARMPWANLRLAKKERDHLSQVLQILTDEDKRLRLRASEVAEIDGGTRVLIDNLIATLTDFRSKAGFGRAIAAPQVGACLRIIALHLGATPFALINPEITWKSSELIDVWDDCLSVPDRLVKVQRHRRISLRYQNEKGQWRTWENLPVDLAELVQHEIDHLDGILMLDRGQGEACIRPMSERATLPTVAAAPQRISLQGILCASQCIDPAFLATPQFVCEPLSAELGCRLLVKVEVLNPIRSFKGRGADYFVQQARAQGDRRKMACASAGNWGQAMAYVCRGRGESVDIFAAETVNPLKAQRMREMGAVLHLAGNDFDAAKATARTYCAEQGLWLVEDGLEVEISEGAGSIAVELLAGGETPDVVLIPLGNGALLNGMARWIKAASPSTRVIGVAARGAPAMAKSWRAREPIAEATVDTIADGVAVRTPVPEAVQDMLPLVDDVLLVDDTSMVHAMRLAHRHMGLVLEPSGALGIAAIAENPAQFQGKLVATVLCGGNLAPVDVRKYLYD